MKIIIEVHSGCVTGVYGRPYLVSDSPVEVFVVDLDGSGDYECVKLPIQPMFEARVATVKAFEGRAQ